MEYKNLFFEPRDFGEGLAVTGCLAGATQLVVPARVDGVPVMAVAEGAFSGNTTLEEILFEEADAEMQIGAISFEEIGDSAFRGCTSLVRVVLPSDSCISVGSGAFASCTSLQEAAAPGCTLFLASYAFYGCEELRKLSPLYYAGEGALEDCSSLERVTFAERATEIGEDAFRGCKSLTEVFFPSSFKQIGQDAFRGCASLRRAEFAITDGWYWECAYYEGKQPLDLSDPEENARVLSTMDFDDGVLWWKRDLT